MDEIVQLAMQKWPNVPDCYGWVGLDIRGNWFMRDEITQHAGIFGSGCANSKGSLLKHEKLIDFIGRNYQAKENGAWYFQNGPQKVYIELELTPWIWRIGLDFEIRSHTGLMAKHKAAWLDELGYLYVETNLGIGLVHTQDMELASEAVQSGVWSPNKIEREYLSERFSFVKNPVEQ